MILTSGPIYAAVPQLEIQARWLGQIWCCKQHSTTWHGLTAAMLTMFLGGFLQSMTVCAATHESPFLHVLTATVVRCQIKKKTPLLWSTAKQLYLLTFRWQILEQCKMSKLQGHLFVVSRAQIRKSRWGRSPTSSMLAAEMKHLIKGGGDRWMCPTEASLRTALSSAGSCRTISTDLRDCANSGVGYFYQTRMSTLGFK